MHTHRTNTSIVPCVCRRSRGAAFQGACDTYLGLPKESSLGCPPPQPQGFISILHSGPPQKRPFGLPKSCISILAMMRYNPTSYRHGRQTLTFGDSWLLLNFPYLSYHQAQSQNGLHAEPG